MMLTYGLLAIATWNLVPASRPLLIGWGFVMIFC